MNKNLLIARQIIEQNRIEAESKRDSLLMQLDKDFAWKNLQKNIRAKQVEVGFSKGENTEKLKLELEQLLAKRLELLLERNLSPQSLVADYKCKLCNDTGFVNENACRCLKKAYRNVLFENSNLPSRNCIFEKSSEENFSNLTKEQRHHNSLVYKKCQKIFGQQFDGQLKNLTLLGQTGTGKTHLLNCIANMLIENGVEVLFTTAYSLNSQLLAGHLADIDSRQKLLDSLIDVDVLIIDDLGVEQTYKNVTIEYLFSTINERKNLGKHTLVSTNLTLMQMQQIYDDRIFSRLVDKNDTFVAELVGADKRIKSLN